MRIILRLAVLVVIGASVSSCSLPYYWQAVGGQLDLMRKRVPIISAVDDADIDVATREQLQAVIVLRRFAVDEIGLPDNDSYTSYVDLGRPYVVWNVIATEEFSIEPERWCFPIAGCVAYRGYFDRADAERFQKTLIERGFDTYSGGSSAYSTLGYLSDPVLNTMLAGDGVRVAGTLFHELAHQKIYIKDDSELSEAFATTIEEYAVERWLQVQQDTAALDAYRQRLRRREEFAELVAEQRQRLQTMYEQPVSAAQQRMNKSVAFEQMRRNYEALKASWGGIGEFDGWFNAALNNATLVAVSTYRRWVPGLRWRLDEVGLDAFYAEVEGLAESPEDVRARRLEAWNAASAAGRVAQYR